MGEVYDNLGNLVTDIADELDLHGVEYIFTCYTPVEDHLVMYLQGLILDNHPTVIRTVQFSLDPPYNTPDTIITRVKFASSCASFIKLCSRTVRKSKGSFKKLLQA